MGHAIGEMAREVLDQRIKGRPRAIAILEKFTEIAEQGSVAHANFLFWYAFGKPKETLETINHTEPEETSSTLIAFWEANPEVKKKYAEVVRKRLLESDAG